MQDQTGTEARKNDILPPKFAEANLHGGRPAGSAGKAGSFESFGGRALR